MKNIGVDISGFTLQAKRHRYNDLAMTLRSAP